MAGIPTSQSSATAILPSYLYWQYSDDEDLQAFVEAYNEIAQGYLDWFLENPLAIYTGSGISGPLLDWVGAQLYGIPRPVLGTTTNWWLGPLNTMQVNTIAVNGELSYSFGQAAAVSDDVYKRVLTWWLYAGDGKQTSIDWVKRRVARFLYGVNGADIAYPPEASIGAWPDVAIVFVSVLTGAVNTAPVNVLAVNASMALSAQQITITVTAPASNGASKILQQFVQQGIIPLPFETTFTVELS